MKLGATSSQTVGPFFRIGLAPLYCSELAGPETPGERVEIEGQVVDGDGNTVPDAILEVWQADANGQYPAQEVRQDTDKGFRGFGRIATNEEGRFHFSTIKPGPVDGPNGGKQAPHLAVSLFMRGLLQRLVTRIYFPGEAANDHDPILKLVDPDRRLTLVAQSHPETPGTLHWDIHLQGERETVFFDC